MIDTGAKRKFQVCKINVRFSSMLFVIHHVLQHIRHIPCQVLGRKNKNKKNKVRKGETWKTFQASIRHTVHKFQHLANYFWFVIVNIHRIQDEGHQLGVSGQLVAVEKGLVLFVTVATHRAAIHD